MIGAAMLAACSTEELPEQSTQEPEFNFSVCINSENGGATRMSMQKKELGKGYPLVWDIGDQVWITGVNTSGGAAGGEYRVTRSGDASPLERVNTAGNRLDSYHYFMSFYPQPAQDIQNALKDFAKYAAGGYGDLTTYDPFFRIYLPTEQILDQTIPDGNGGTEAYYDKNALIMASLAGIENQNVELRYNVAVSFLRFEADTEGLTRITISSRNGEQLSGLGALFPNKSVAARDSMRYVIPTSYGTLQSETSITVRPANGGTFQKGKSYYVCLWPSGRNNNESVGYHLTIKGYKAGDDDEHPSVQKSTGEKFLTAKRNKSHYIGKL